MNPKPQFNYDPLIDYLVDIGLSLHFGCPVLKVECMYSCNVHLRRNSVVNDGPASAKECTHDGSASTKKCYMYSVLAYFHRSFRIVNEKLSG